jgi:UrcA family protein
MFTKSALTALSAVLALGLVGVANGASAQSSDTVSVNVPYGDLNLSNPAAAHELHNRVQNAARAICGDEPTAPMDRMTQYEPCVKKITDQALAGFQQSATASRDSTKLAANIR